MTVGQTIVTGCELCYVAEGQAEGEQGIARVACAGTLEEFLAFGKISVHTERWASRLEGWRAK